MNKTITFIGAGNMARSLVSGLTKDDMQYDIRISDPNPEQLQGIKQHWPTVSSFTDNIEAIKNAEVVVLAVKPQLMEMVCEPLQNIIETEKPLIISIEAADRNNNSGIKTSNQENHSHRIVEKEKATSLLLNPENIFIGPKKTGKIKIINHDVQTLKKRAKTRN